MSYSSYVLSNPDLIAHFNKNIKASGKSMEDWGKTHWSSFGEKEHRQNTPTTTEITSTETVAAPKTAESYVDSSPDLADAYKKMTQDPTGLQGSYWLQRMGGQTSKEAFGKAHAAEDMQLKTGTYKGGTDFKLGTDAWKGLFTSKVGQFGDKSAYGDRVSGVDSPQTRYELFQPTTTTQKWGPVSGGDDTTTGTDTTSSVVNNENTQVQLMEMAKLTDEMDLSNKLKEVININSPLFKAAQTKAMQAMSARGLVNSSIANEAVMNAILDVAMPIAQAEVNALQTNLYYNTDWTNQQKTQANAHYYNTVITKLNASISKQLQAMQQGFQAWGRYGDWISRIGTTPGMDPAAMNWTMGALPSFWQQGWTPNSGNATKLPPKVYY